MCTCILSRSIFVDYWRSFKCLTAHNIALSHIVVFKIHYQRKEGQGGREVSMEGEKGNHFVTGGWREEAVITIYCLLKMKYFYFILKSSKVEIIFKTYMPEASTQLWCLRLYGWQGTVFMLIILIKIIHTLFISPQCRRPRFDAWVRKMPWRRKWQPILVLLLRKFHGWRSLVG